MKKHLVISALGVDRPGIVKSVSKQILDAGGNVSDSRMSVLGDEFALIMLVDGTDTVINSIISLLPSIEKELGLTVMSKQTTKQSDLEAKSGSRLPYIAEVVAMDNPGIVHEVSEFLSSRNVNVEELATGSYPAPHTGTTMFSMEMSISIPSDTNISSFKSDFYDFCDEINLDVTLSAH